MAKIKSKLVKASERVWKAYKALGSININDGSPEGTEFEDSILEMRLVANQSTYRTSAERAALVDIVNAYNANPNPIHYKVSEAINKAREAIQESDMSVDE